MKTNKGFTLLMAIVTTSLLLVVSFMVVNIAFKQLVISDANEESQYAFYNADTGIECGTFWDLKHTGSATNPFNPSTPSNISCGGSAIAPVRTPYVSGYSTSTFTVTMPKGCADVEVVKNQYTRVTNVISRGYNNCTVGALRRFQRGVSNTFPSNPPIPVNVIFTSTIGVTVTGNAIFKTGLNGWGNAGGISTQSITSGDGYVEFSVTDTTSWKIAGLGVGNSDASYTDIDFGILPAGNGLIEIYENGVARSFNVGSYVAGDVFKVAVELGVVKYYKNGSLLYTSIVAPTYPLIFDTAIFTRTARITNAKIAS